MKKQSIYTRLQNQYKKLNSRIQKSIKTGKFYQFTQFKQQQLLERLKRYTLQLKQVTAGIAVVGALGVATPAVGQYVPPPYMVHDGGDNPLDGLHLGTLVGGEYHDRPIFVDIDNDGDYDVFAAEKTNYLYAVYAHVHSITYYENIGTAYVPSFVQRTGALNPLDTFAYLHNLEFVDIDNDGDLDCFGNVESTINSYSLGGNLEFCTYIENTGTATNAVFEQKTGNNNPLDTLNSLYSNPGFHEVNVSFVDLNNDGDFDCFATIHDHNPADGRIVYIENQGSATVPNLVLQSAVMNVLNGINSDTNLPNLHTFIGKLKMEFHDIDKDGDLDALGLVANGYYYYYENIGTVSSPNFYASFATSARPFDSCIGASDFSIVDIDNDGDLDFFTTNNDDEFWENLDTTIVSGVLPLNEEVPFTIFPNPTSGILKFENELTGYASLYNVTGQKLFEQELEYVQELDLSELDNGLYFLYIETDGVRRSKKVLIQK